MTSRKVAYVSLIAIFILGFALGATVDRIFLDKNKPSSSRHRHDNEKIVEDFSRQLDLSPDQVARLEQLLTQVKNQHREVHKKLHLEYKRVRQQFKDSFLETLAPEQKEKFLEIEKKYENKEKH